MAQKMGGMLKLPPRTYNVPNQQLASFTTLPSLLTFRRSYLFMIKVSNENIANEMGSIHLPQNYGSQLSLGMSSIASLVFLEQAAMPCQQCVATAASF